jgi:hypothetical protein
MPAQGNALGVLKKNAPPGKITVVLVGSFGRQVATVPPPWVRSARLRVAHSLGQSYRSPYKKPSRARDIRRNRVSHLMEMEERGEGVGASSRTSWPNLKRVSISAPSTTIAPHG